ESGPCLSASVAGHPLRPATHRRLGEPLPHQLANGPQGHPQPVSPLTDKPCASSAASGISPSFPGLSRRWGTVPYALLTRPPLGCSLPPRRASGSIPARLACIRHAASVRPEPGSNSPIIVLQPHRKASARGAGCRPITGKPNPAYLLASVSSKRR